jgi:peptide/nickel transport system permease protein
MLKHILRRLIQSIPTFFGITILAYLLMSLTPGGPLGALTFGNPRMRPDQQEQIAIRLGINDPIPVQYLRWLLGDDWMRWDTDNDGIADKSFLIPLDANDDGENEPPGTRRGILRGDFGASFFNNRPVLNILTERLPATLELSVSSLLVGASLGILIGVIAAVKRGSWFDTGSRVLSVVFDAIPGFWLSLLLIMLFAVVLKDTPLELPLGGRCKTTLDDSCPPIYARLQYMILPVFILSTGLVAGYSRFMRSSMLDIISQDYIRTARSKGLSNRRVWFLHGLRNALIPIATFLGPTITGLLGGAVITETVFNFPGVGLTVVQAFTQRDYPVVMAVTIYAAVATILGYLLSDILYALIDPRIRY